MFRRALMFSSTLEFKRQAGESIKKTTGALLFIRLRPKDSGSFFTCFASNALEDRIRV